MVDRPSLSRLIWTGDHIDQQGDALQDQEQHKPGPLPQLGGADQRANPGYRHGERAEGDDDDDYDKEREVVRRRGRPPYALVVVVTPFARLSSKMTTPTAATARPLR